VPKPIIFTYHIRKTTLWFTIIGDFSWKCLYKFMNA